MQHDEGMVGVFWHNFGRKQKYKLSLGYATNLRICTRFFCGKFRTRIFAKTPFKYLYEKDTSAFNLELIFLHCAISVDGILASGNFYSWRAITLSI
jgi:hypothetical protein